MRTLKLFMPGHMHLLAYTTYYPVLHERGVLHPLPSFGENTEYTSP